MAAVIQWACEYPHENGLHGNDHSPPTPKAIFLFLSNCCHSVNALNLCLHYVLFLLVLGEAIARNYHGCFTHCRPPRHNTLHRNELLNVPFDLMVNVQKKFKMYPASAIMPIIQSKEVSWSHNDPNYM